MDSFPVKNISGPDGIEAWCVALAAMVINFIMAGLGRMSGILYVAFIEIFQIDRRDASLPFSVRSSIRNLLGPVVGILGQKYGARPVVITGAIIGSLSAATLFYVKEFLWITILWGGISGFGAALTTTLNQAVIGQHFKKYRTTAAGMAFSGGCIGSFLFPALLEYLLHTYGLGGTFLLIAGILMQAIPAALVLRKPTWWDSKKPEVPISTISGDLQEISSQNEAKGCQATTGNDGRGIDKNGFMKKDSPDNSKSKNLLLTDSTAHFTSKEQFCYRKIDADLLWKNRILLIRLLTKDFTLKCPISDIFQKKYFLNINSVKEIEELFDRICLNVYNDELHPINSSSATVTSRVYEIFDDKFIKTRNAPYASPCSGLYLNESSNIIRSDSLNCLSSSLKHLFEKGRKYTISHISEKDKENISKVLKELWYIHRLLDKNEIKVNVCSKFSNTALTLSNKTENVEGNSVQSNSIWSHIKTALKLYSKPIFVLICLCRAAHLMTFMPIITTVVDFSMDKGLPEEDGKYVIAVLSLGDLLGRLCLGWITDHGYVTLPRYMLVVMVIQSASTATLAFMDSRATLLSAIAVFGLLQGSIFVRHPVLVSRYLESHEQSIAMGCLNFFSGLVAFVLPIYIGYFRDTIGSYNGMLFINGAIGASIGLLWIFEPLFVKFSKSRQKDHQITL